MYCTDLKCASLYCTALFALSMDYITTLQHLVLHATVLTKHYTANIKVSFTLGAGNNEKNDSV
jgi:hypothetical protein